MVKKMPFCANLISDVFFKERKLLTRLPTRPLFGLFFLGLMLIWFFKKRVRDRLAATSCFLVWHLILIQSAEYGSTAFYYSLIS